MTKAQEKELLIIGVLAAAGVVIYLVTRKTTTTTPVATGTVTVSNAQSESATQYLENQGINVAESYGSTLLQNLGL